MSISEKIEPFSDIKIREFLKDNADLVRSYDINSLSDFFKEIIELKSDIINEELVKLKDIYKVIIMDKGEERSFFDYFVSNIDEKSHAIVGKFININLEKNTNFLDYHLSNKIDLVHILLKNEIIPNNRLMKRWLAAHPTEKDFINDNGEPLCIKKGLSLLKNRDLLEFLKKNKNYFSVENIIGDEFYQKEIIYKTCDENIKMIVTFYEMQDFKEYLEEIFKNAKVLTNECIIVMSYLNDIDTIKNNVRNNGGRMSYFARRIVDVQFEDVRDVYLKVKMIWSLLSGSIEKRERDLSYMVSSLNYFGEQNEKALEYIKDIKNESEAMNKIITKNSSADIVEKTRKRI